MFDYEPVDGLGHARWHTASSSARNQGMVNLDLTGNFDHTRIRPCNWTYQGHPQAA